MTPKLCQTGLCYQSRSQLVFQGGREENWKLQAASERNGIQSFYPNLRSWLGEKRFILRTGSQIYPSGNCFGYHPTSQARQLRTTLEKTVNVKCKAHYCYTCLHLPPEHTVFLRVIQLYSGKMRGFLVLSRTSNFRLTCSYMAPSCKVRHLIGAFYCNIC